MPPNRKDLATMTSREMRSELQYFRQKYKSLHNRVPYGSQVEWVDGKKKKRCGECEGKLIFLFLFMQNLVLISVLLIQIGCLLKNCGSCKNCQDPGRHKACAKRICTMKKK